MFGEMTIEEAKPGADAVRFSPLLWRITEGLQFSRGWLSISFASKRDNVEAI
jgi:hypothetical protein